MIKNNLNIDEVLEQELFDIKYDFAFKRVFMYNEESKEALKGFIESVLKSIGNLNDIKEIRKGRNR